MHLSMKIKPWPSRHVFEQNYTFGLAFNSTKQKYECTFIEFMEMGVQETWKSGPNWSASRISVLRGIANSAQSVCIVAVKYDSSFHLCSFVHFQSAVQICSVLWDRGPVIARLTSCYISEYLKYAYNT